MAAPAVTVVDYGRGNLRSVCKALERAGAAVELTDRPAAVRAADRLVLPGVGAFGDAMERLRDTGLDEAVRDLVEAGRPYLGICLGLQLLFERGDEGAGDNDGLPGLGLLPGRVSALPLQALRAQGLKLPHMGWSPLKLARSDPAFPPPPAEPWFYFVHSYHALPADPDLVLATADYGMSVTAAVRRGSLLAVQFHPEKSQKAGLDLLRRWLTEPH